MPTIIPTDTEQAGDIARRLLDAADSPDEVRTNTAGSTTSFEVSDELAIKAGFILDDEDDEDLDVDAADSPETETANDFETPPRSGRGSGEQAWRDFLTAQGVEFDPDADRDALIAIWDTHHAPQE